MTESTLEKISSSDGPVGPKVNSSTPTIEQPPSGDKDKRKKKNLSNMRHAQSSHEVLVTEPSTPKVAGNFEELVEKRLIKRRNSFQENDKFQKRQSNLMRAPNMFMALLGDNDLSDPESMNDSDEDETTSKDSNSKLDAPLSSRSTTSLHNDNIDRTPTPSFFEDID